MIQYHTIFIFLLVIVSVSYSYIYMCDLLSLLLLLLLLLLSVRLPTHTDKAKCYKPAGTSEKIEKGILLFFGCNARKNYICLHNKYVHMEAIQKYLLLIIFKKGFTKAQAHKYCLQLYMRHMYSYISYIFYVAINSYNAVLNPTGIELSSRQKINTSLYRLRN